uniref:Uncharacterized protein n=1 Tax=Grammatophora oceanica TaxID=210454 RepID=A0A7S1YEK3_9STRA|mmetsp:Transcript_46424/g.69107  ORF Transcript_46424/g.69107 Transcript_46424/m.69107 type:complete len:221 (+) Transcript_46424:90-752(+)|eukprot:CAMPEP_0194051512 /NCGR_PEP_ID=MMETSP0009_2-20130614/40824_1 /TAXON_ID=210454 /ORGANISM="Grammatophora oceanica, Strain CCMP 410" /LENGTH=220 /DNA_ID=CAMNT_0038698619 /DNA_START=90 /DNA_END=752 /DNA_ORIENTATION=+
MIASRKVCILSLRDLRGWFLVGLICTLMVAMSARAFRFHGQSYRRAVHGPVHRSHHLPHSGGARIGQQRRCTTLSMAGGFGTPSKKGGSDRAKVRPKQQWDRYKKMKKDKLVRVAVRVDGQGDWLEVGRVKSQGSEYTEFALAVQKSLIIEHSRRLYPLQVSRKAKLECAYFETESEDWKVLEKKAVDAPDGIIKMVGFEGRPDPASGFYCRYEKGRLVD